ncbi:hypothetical protein [Nocardioides bizhenqiangii]|uniref:Integral membrane protein n=1 Tax=Nocardioides bizhenqiangii TaxID=3095076 RepID=A0ABZ0ZMW8_9ACTN|nr:hypothetical protein [Nocardioides sp. HM61]WQQ25124.1 hypothetical protein SHK19_14255 [Nocardioides sp. HM61]
MPPRDSLSPAEQWFVAHGLPYFVDSYRAGVAAGLRRGRIAVVLLVAVVVGAVVGVVTAIPLSAAAGIGAALSAVGLVLAVYAVVTLRAWLIVGWAIRRTFRSLGLLLPLVTRALPLLLLFITFLFINAEVWQVSAALDGGVLWVTVMLFAGVAVGFLLTRLPEELDSVDDEVDSRELLDACRGTPLETAAEAIAGRVERVGRVDAEVAGLQKANLVLVLLVSQAVQVLLLALSVFAFFIVFGVVAMDPGVVASWTGGPLDPVVSSMGAWDGDRLSRELVQVSVFLAAFSGLYFTVYAVTDDVYRKQFFSSVIRELERAVSARVAYRSMRTHDAD